MRAHGWSTVFGWGLTLSGAALAFFGCLGLFIPDPSLTLLASLSFASLMAFAIACANVAADVAVKALRRRADGAPAVAWDAFILATLTCAGFAIAANIGVHLGWELLAARVAPGVKLPDKTQVDLAFYVLCAGKPLAGALISYLGAFDLEDADAAKARRDKHHLAVLAARQPDPETAVTEAARQARLRAAGVTDIAPGSAARAASERPTEAEIIAAAKRLIGRGVTPSNRTLAAEMDLPRSRIERGSQAWRALITGPEQPSLMAAAAS